MIQNLKILPFLWDYFFEEKKSKVYAMVSKLNVI